MVGRNERACRDGEEREIESEHWLITYNAGRPEARGAHGWVENGWKSGPNGSLLGLDRGAAGFGVGSAFWRKLLIKRMIATFDLLDFMFLSFGVGRSRIRPCFLPDFS